MVRVRVRVRVIVEMQAWLMVCGRRRTVHDGHALSDEDVPEDRKERVKRREDYLVVHHAQRQVVHLLVEQQQRRRQLRGRVSVWGRSIV